MKIFDAVLNRKPTLAEIEKFSETENEQNMLDNIVNQYSTKGEEGADVPVNITTIKPQTDTPIVVDPTPPLFKTFSLEEVNVMVKKIDDMMITANEFKKQLLL
jgi:hypothetical protein